MLQGDQFGLPQMRKINSYLSEKNLPFQADIHEKLPGSSSGEHLKTTLKHQREEKGNQENGKQKIALARRLNWNLNILWCSNLIVTENYYDLKYP